MNRQDLLLSHISRFYSVYLKDKLHDNKVDAEWFWFLSRLKDEQFRGDKVDQYFRDLAKDTKEAKLQSLKASSSTDALENARKISVVLSPLSSQKADNRKTIKISHRTSK